jgi:hypothetical protein
MIILNLSCIKDTDSEPSCYGYLQDNIKASKRIAVNTSGFIIGAVITVTVLTNIKSLNSEVRPWVRF